MMGKKRPKPAPTKQLEDLLRAHALRRLEGSVAPKRVKAKQARKRKKR
jgi:hypothetical protein